MLRFVVDRPQTHIADMHKKRQSMYGMWVEVLPAYMMPDMKRGTWGEN